MIHESWVVYFSSIAYISLLFIFLFLWIETGNLEPRLLKMHEVTIVLYSRDCEMCPPAKPVQNVSEHNSVVGLSCLIQFEPLHRFTDESRMIQCISPDTSRSVMTVMSNISIGDAHKTQP